MNSADPSQIALKMYKLLILNCLYGHYDRAYEVLEFAQQKDLWSSEQVASIRKSLASTQGFWFRIPKFEKKGGFYEWAYHLFMGLGGYWLKRTQVWRPIVKL